MRPKKKTAQRFWRWAVHLVLNAGAAGRNRTHDPLVRSQVLYPAELQPRRREVYHQNGPLGKAQGTFIKGVGAGTGPDRPR